MVQRPPDDGDPTSEEEALEFDGAPWNIQSSH